MISIWLIIAVRALCCETGFLGKAIDPVFEDRELFADFLTDYYLKHEPDSAFVLAKGCTHGFINRFRHLPAALEITKSAAAFFKAKA